MIGVDWLDAALHNAGVMDGVHSGEPIDDALGPLSERVGLEREL